MPASWPKDDRPADFADIADPIYAAIRFAYNMKRRNADCSIPWRGPEIGRAELATCLPAKEQLQKQNLAYSLNNQGRDALAEIISLALRLGIEQGRRIERTERAPLDRTERALALLKKELPNAS